MGNSFLFDEGMVETVTSELGHDLCELGFLFCAFDRMEIVEVVESLNYNL